MEPIYFEDQKFEKADFSETGLKQGEYEYCSFIQCNFSNTDLSGSHFMECEFIDCNLSMAKLSKTGLKTVRFKNCKLLGLHFEQCSEFLFAVEFENCTINLCSFYKLKLKKTIFKSSSLAETDFTEADLTSAVFDNCDLSKTIFENTILEKADFRTSNNYLIDPDLNKIKKAMFSYPGVLGLLGKHDIVVD